MGARVRITAVVDASRRPRCCRGGRSCRSTGDPVAICAGGVVNAESAVTHAQTIVSLAGYGGTVSVGGDTVTVTVTASVDYAFPSPGFLASVSGTSTAVVARGVTGSEGG